MTSNASPRNTDIHTTTAQELRVWLKDGQELALIDVREAGVHARDGHILLGINLPLSGIELRIGALVPEKTTRVVLYDGGDDVFATIAHERLLELGYTHVHRLIGGAAGWKEAGYHLFSGFHVIGKAFGEHVEHQDGTPHLSAEDVKRRLDAGENIVVVDSRPEPEFKNFSIPGAVDLPGAEIVHRFYAAVPDPKSLVVVNCAGRTRSIIGAQALINAGVPNKVVSLANGTMDWAMAGYDLARGRTNLAPAPQGRALDAAKEAASRLRARYRLKTLSRADLLALQSDARASGRSVYLLDVRTAEEYHAGHILGSRHAPGGQLVQQIGNWVGTRNAQIVLIDNSDGIRAAITGSWLQQLNWGEVFLLTDALSGQLETGHEPIVLSKPKPQVNWVDPLALHGFLKSSTVVVLDIDTSVAYKAGHIPEARFVIRSYLETNPAAIPGTDLIVLTSSDGASAAFAAASLASRTKRPVAALEGGTIAWRTAGLPLDIGLGQALHPFEDLALSAWSLPESEQFPAFRAYLDWELSLVDQLEKDGTAIFRTFPPRVPAAAAE